MISSQHQQQRVVKNTTISNANNANNEAHYSKDQESQILPSAPKNYSHSFRYTLSNDIIAFETGYYGLIVNPKNLRTLLFCKFGSDEEDIIHDRSAAARIVTYSQCLQERHRKRMDPENLESEEFRIEICVGGRSFIATHAENLPRLWEAGKICQRYDFRGIEFQGLKENVKHIHVDATLVILVWPDCITFQVDVKLDGSNENEMNNGILIRSRISPVFVVDAGFTIKIKFQDWNIQQKHVLKDASKEIFSTILSCNLTNHLEQMRDTNGGVKIEVQTNPSQFLFSTFDRAFNCFTIRSEDGNLKRSFLGGYRDIRDYDEFKINIYNAGFRNYVPILLEVQPLANPTGVCPIVCDENYIPTGIPIQLSKNWHIQGTAPYGRFYCFLPAIGYGLSKYVVRIVYGFYGTLPSASHANLSLIGYHDHGTRWEQLAIGCWGESYCMDIDMGCTERTITDIRMLMTKGIDNIKWNWSDAGWGGDWGNFKEHDGQRLMPFQWKSGYLSHGPCLSNVQYSGWYGEEKKVYLSANVKTSRSDDYCRTFTSLKYEFKRDVLATNSSFFQLGTAKYIRTPRIVWGNNAGQVEERDLKNIPTGVYLEKIDFEGVGPWWFGFPGQRQVNDKEWGKGWRGLVIRNFTACFGKRRFEHPTFSLTNSYVESDNTAANMKFMLQPPVMINEFKKGDWLSFEVEVVTFPRDVLSYYGSNQFFREHLKTNADNWHTLRREAAGNDVSIMIYSGGEVMSQYPIIIAVADENATSFTTKGGIGAVPIQFIGLVSKEYSLYHISNNGEILLDQSRVHDNDFWQSEFSFESTSTQLLVGRYSLSFNINVDPIAESKWILRRNKGKESYMI